MKVILVIDIPDDIWKNKDEELGMCCEVWSMRIDDGWCGEYYKDSLIPLPQYITMRNTVSCDYNEGYVNGYNTCIDKILDDIDVNKTHPDAIPIKWLEELREYKDLDLYEDKIQAIIDEWRDENESSTI